MSINLKTLNGYAFDAAALGGKTPEYYTPYENRADNSDFRRFVAQAGVGGSHGTQAYGGDRWILDSGTITGTANANGDGYGSITLNGTIRQIIANAEQNMTAFVGMISGTAEVNYSYSGGVGTLTIASAGGVLDWVLLLPGTWESAPPYVPKGYAAELAECQRYYYRSWIDGTLEAAKTADRGWLASPVGSEYGAIPVFTFPQTMRIVPTVTVYAKDTLAAGYASRWDAKDKETETVANRITKECFGLNSPNGIFETGKIYCVYYEASADL